MAAGLEARDHVVLDTQRGIDEIRLGGIGGFPGAEGFPCGAAGERGNPRCDDAGGRQPKVRKPATARGMRRRCRFNYNKGGSKAEPPSRGWRMFTGGKNAFVGTVVSGPRQHRSCFQREGLFWKRIRRARRRRRPGSPPRYNTMMFSWAAGFLASALLRRRKQRCRQRGERRPRNVPLRGFVCRSS